MKNGKYFIGLIILLTTLGCTKTNNQKLLSKSLSDSLNVIIIDADIDYDPEVILPMIRTSKESKFSFSPYCPFWCYDSIENKASIYSKFTSANLSEIKTLVLVKYNGIHIKHDIGVGYLYNSDTLNITSIGSIDENAFRIISNGRKLFFETNNKIQGNAVYANYYRNYHPEKQVKFIEKYVFKLIKDVNKEVLIDGYICE